MRKGVLWRMFRKGFKEILRKFWIVLRHRDSRQDCRSPIIEKRVFEGILSKLEEDFVWFKAKRTLDTNYSKNGGKNAPISKELTPSEKLHQFYIIFHLTIATKSNRMITRNHPIIAHLQQAKQPIQTKTKIK